MVATPEVTGPELFFGIVAPTGTDTTAVETELRDALSRVNYNLQTIKLSKLLDSAPNAVQYSGTHEDERVRHYQTAGNELCKSRDRGDAVVLLGLADVIQRRAEANQAKGSEDEAPLPRTGFLFSSLKRPYEVETLRRVYGPWFFLIAVDCPSAIRLKNLKSKISSSRHSWNESRVEREANELITIDRQQEDEQWGQNVLHTFARADLFVHFGDNAELRHSIERFIDLIFGDTTVTPSKQEHAMALAYTSALRSGSQSRRVGATLLRDDHVIALGTNQIPKAKGGHDFPADHPEARDVTGTDDFNKHQIQSIVSDVLSRFKLAEMLSESAAAKVDASLDSFVAETTGGVLKESSLADLIEYQIPVHAELSAILDAGRRGERTQDAAIYCTTYPCHLCTKEMLYAGITDVTYIEPYPKSHSQAMYHDSISEADEALGVMKLHPYVGVAPHKYHEWFVHPIRQEKRKNRDFPLPYLVYGSPAVGITERELGMITA